MQVHPLERDLLLKIRNRFRFGRIQIETRDGLPDRIGQVIVWEKVSASVIPIEGFDDSSIDDTMKSN